MKPSFLLVGCLTFLALSCGLKTSDKIDSDKVNAEIKARKIKRIKDSEIVKSAFEKGEEIAKDWLPRLTKLPSPCGFTDFDTLPKQLSLLIKNKRIVCQTQTEFHSKEKAIWEAYEAAFPDQLPQKGNLQKLEGDDLLYTHPILYTDDGGDRQLSMLRIVLSKREIIRAYDPKKGQ